MWWNHITASLTAVCLPLVPVQWVSIGMQEHVYWKCNQKQKREEWLGKLLPAATLSTYLRRFSLLLNWTCLQTLMSSPPNWCLFKHAMAFCLAQHSGSSLSSWNSIQSKCFEGTCLFNLAKSQRKRQMSLFQQFLRHHFTTSNPLLFM